MGRAGVCPAPTALDLAASQTEHPSAGIRRGPARGRVPAAVAHHRQPSARVPEVVGLPVLLTEQFAQTLPNPLLAKPDWGAQMFGNSLSHQGGIRAPQTPERSLWGLGFEADGHVGDSVDLGEVLRSFGEGFAVAQSNLSSSGAKAMAAVEITARTLL